LEQEFPGKRPGFHWVIILPGLPGGKLALNPGKLGKEGHWGISHGEFLVKLPFWPGNQGEELGETPRKAGKPIISRFFGPGKGGENLPKTPGGKISFHWD